MAKEHKRGKKVDHAGRFTDIIRKARKQAADVVTMATHRTVVGQLNLELLAAKNREEGLRLDLKESELSRATLVKEWTGRYADKVRQLWNAEVDAAKKGHQLSILGDIIKGDKIEAIIKVLAWPSARTIASGAGGLVTYDNTIPRDCDMSSGDIQCDYVTGTDPYPFQNCRFAIGHSGNHKIHATVDLPPGIKWWRRREYLLHCPKCWTVGRYMLRATEPGEEVTCVPCLNHCGAQVTQNHEVSDKQQAKGVGR